MSYLQELVWGDWNKHITYSLVYFSGFGFLLVHATLVNYIKITAFSSHSFSDFAAQNGTL